MFTGITEYLAVIEDIRESAIKKTDPSKTETKSKGNHHTEITIRLYKSKGIKIGDSVSVSGVCLTVAKLDGTKATFQVIDETMNKTNFKDLKKGDRVNIERSLRVGGRIEGHFVLGHVDGTGIIKRIEKGDKGSKLKVKIPSKELLPFIVKKGSIAIDGVSLTVVDVKNSIVEIALIPHTLKNTTLGLKKIDDSVNIEIDILARYLTKIYQYSGNNKKNSKIY
ncbi:riboflavin synthase [Candidatus Nitrosocosmicus franklandus]|uniref:Riboflavin synthase n=1 Tax=Candidatus Nitrosocosmicus franklandianus TaxID=1798806 RepID=A0A484I6J6_9ARCH|nr:riboflavin synthase [Candidatus Nitrosocosmicus franklandus]VFJ13349.1 Riboflavin synthase [Candidatus Nitrosocosmicus franklandus]